MRGTVAGLIVAGLALATAGCGGQEEEPVAEVFNPCDLLDATALANAVDSNVVVDLGDSEVPRCTLVPSEDGKAVLDVNYMTWTNLPDAWDSMDAPELAYTSPDIGDAARIVTQPGDDILGVTGVVESNGKVFMVNALDPVPYSVTDLRAAVRMAMLQLADGGPSPTPSP